MLGALWGGSVPGLGSPQPDPHWAPHSQIPSDLSCSYWAPHSQIPSALSHSYWAIMEFLCCQAGEEGGVT